MSYLRVIPRDLFNEANLLKCYGKLYIELEKINLEKILIYTENNKEFNIIQDLSGDLYIDNINIKNIDLFRPLNSREAWPLYALYNDTEYEIFNNEGNFNKEFKELLLDLDW